MATRKTKSAAVAPAVPVPQNREQCQAQLTHLGQMLRRHAVLKAEMDGKIADITQTYAGALSDLQAEAERLHQGIALWASANRDALTQGGKVKTANLVTGEIAWRNRPPSVTVRNAEAVLKSLKELGLSSYVRTEEAVSKEGLLELRAAATKITQEELDQQDDDGDTYRAIDVDYHMVLGIKGITFNTEVEDFTATPFETETATALVP